MSAFVLGGVQETKMRIFRIVGVGASEIHECVVWCGVVWVCVCVCVCMCVGRLGHAPG